MIYLFIILIVILALVIMSIVSEYSLIKKLKIKLKEEWGDVPQQEYTSEKLESIKAYYLSKKDNVSDVDDITWNDIDMDEIYMMMNNTQCSIGEEYLYALLRKPCLEKEELIERNRLMNFFEKKEEERVSVQTKLRLVGKLSRISVYEYINRLNDLDAKSNLGHFLMNLGLLLSIGLIFISPGIGGICTVVMVVNNILQYYKEKPTIENYLTIFAFIFRLLDQSKELYKLDIQEIKPYTDMIKQDSERFNRYRRSAILLTPKQTSGNLADLILDYVRMFTHIDLIMYNSMVRFFKNHRETLNRIYENIGLLDSMAAGASFRALIHDYCEPELVNTSHAFLYVNDLYHPLIDEPVVNSIAEDGSVLLTGSNASGKSTFIKTLAINAILSQTIYTSTSKSYKSSFFKIYSSMALRDNVLSKESYYIVEIKSLKRILNQVKEGVPTLCFIDEVLRGTNTLERIAASSRILSSLAHKNAMVFAATHDIELTHILEKDFSNYHFQERIEENNIIFDYKLYKGKAVSKNAIKLLNMLGYPKEIIDSAEGAAEDFLNKGEWSRVN